MDKIVERLIQNRRKRLNESITLEDIQGAKGSSSFMDDSRPTITVDGREYIKIGKNKWQFNSPQSHVLGSIISDQSMYDKVIQGSEIKYTDL